MNQLAQQHDKTMQVLFEHLSLESFKPDVVGKVGEDSVVFAVDKNVDADFVAKYPKRRGILSPDEIQMAKYAAGVLKIPIQIGELINSDNQIIAHIILNHKVGSLSSIMSQIMKTPNAPQESTTDLTFKDRFEAISYLMDSKLQSMAACIFHQFFPDYDMVNMGFSLQNQRVELFDFGKIRRPVSIHSLVQGQSFSFEDEAARIAPYLLGGLNTQPDHIAYRTIRMADCLQFAGSINPIVTLESTDHALEILLSNPAAKYMWGKYREMEGMLRGSSAIKAPQFDMQESRKNLATFASTYEQELIIGMMLSYNTLSKSNLFSLEKAHEFTLRWI